MANSEKIYEALISLRTDNAQLKTDLAQASSIIKGGMANLQGPMDKTLVSVRPLGSAITLIAGELTNLGPAANFASNALTSLATAGGPAGIALGILAGTVALFTSRISAAREELRAMAERELATLGRETKALQFDQQLRGTLKVLESFDPQLESIRQKYEELRVTQKDASPETQERLNRAAMLETNKVLDERAAAAGKVQQQIQNEISARQFETAAIGRSGAALDALNLAQRLNAINTRILTGEHGALMHQLGQEEVAAFRLKSAHDQINTGRQTVTGFQQDFGVTFDFENKQAADKLASQFASVFNVLKGDPKAQEPLTQAFSALVQQAVKLGVPDVGELLAEKIGGANFERLRATLSEPIKAALDATSQVGVQWGAPFIEESKRVTEAFGNVGQQVNDFQKRIEDAQAAAAREISMNVNVAQALAEVAKVKSAIDAIPDVTVKKIVTEAVGKASPERPLSQFIPYLQKVLGSVTDDQVANIVYNVPNFSRQMSQISQLQEAYQKNLWGSQTWIWGGNAGGQARLRNDMKRAAENLGAEIGHLQMKLQADIYSAGQRGGGGAAGGVGGGAAANVVIHLEGATLSREFLDEEMIPALERGIIRATGQDPGFRITS